MKLMASKGQQIIEYILLAVVVVVILLAFLRPNGFFHRAVNQTLDVSLNTLGSETAIP